MAADGIAVRPDALDWLRVHLGADHDATRGELGEARALCRRRRRGGIGCRARPVSAKRRRCRSMMRCLRRLRATWRGADRALGLALAEGTAPVGALRAAIYHFQRLHRARLAMDSSGWTATEATKHCRPPIFFRRVPSFTTALDAWSSASLLRALQLIANGEQECKRTGAPDVTLCRQIFGLLARQAASGRAAPG